MDRPQRGLIAAVSPEGVIGLAGKIPWHHPGDMRRFQRVTRGSTVIMGRKTWESMQRRPLRDRRNVVISRSEVAAVGGAVEGFPDLASAMATCNDQVVWFIGGANIYAEGMAYCDVLDITYVPDHVDDPAAVHFPPIDPTCFSAGPLLPHEDEPALTRRIYTRIAR